ncbi:aspartate/glutamate racemase family protein [Labrys neptuniae]|uniref:aspartate/glutamate racemase family protein n=1 Tax=Labrys TaxID=204476 RepID=UPI00288CEC94|nr:aspartate/glutamate racemase family protein [Labrys neptuniae]MDT3376217.1 aspartate/glutamate racemase family protein [Labrys neptuniae]
MPSRSPIHIKPTRIGLIGGLAARAGIYYYERILQEYQGAKIALDLTLRHADVGTVLHHVGSGDRDGLGHYLGSLANELFDAGMDTVSITAVAPHLAIDEIKKRAKGPIIDLLATIPGALKSAGFERVAIFGNRAVMTSAVFGAVPEDMVVKLDPSEIARVHETYTDIALSGKRGTKAEVAYFDDLAGDLLGRRGAQAIMLAGTDLSSFYADREPDFPFLDVSALHIEQILAGI